MLDDKDIIDLFPVEDDDDFPVGFEPPFIPELEDEDEDEKEEMTNNNNTPFTAVYNTKLEEGEKPLSHVIGHENQKKELLNVIDWFSRSHELKEKGVSIPKGVILFGRPGNGKSLLIKEIIRCANAPVFVFQGEQSNIVQGIIETFKKAREAGHAIVVFDELDLLINKERRVARALQENLDGVESSDDILVLAATNNMHDIPEALTRNGRLEKIIRIPYPTGEEAVQLLKKHFDEFKVALPNDFSDEEMALALNGISCAGVKSVVNDVVLRNGFENITVDMINDSINNINDKVKDAEEESNLEVAIHEAGHAVMAKAFPEYFAITRLNIKGASGVFRAKEISEGFWPYDKILADIQISMAGLLAQKIVYGGGSRGSNEDLQRARVAAYNMVTQNGYTSCWEILPQVEPYTRTETYIKRRKAERKIEKVLKTCEKKASKYIRAHSSEIRKLGQLLFEKKYLKSNEILACIG